MPRTALPIAVLALAGSVLLLAAAFAFQHFGGLAPCKLCIWQRWPHALAIAAGLLALGLGRPRACLVPALLLLAGAGIALYHSGIEQGWWQGPVTCSAAPVAGLSTDDLIARITAAPVTRCDEIAWSLLGLSMAAWNGLASLGLAFLWLRAARTRR